MLSGGPISSVPLSALSGSLPTVDSTLAWMPHFPTLIYPRRLAQVQARSFYASNVSPITNPAPPTPTVWLPTLPALIAMRSRQQVTTRLFYASGQQFLGTDLRARAITPSAILTRRRFIQPVQPFQISGVLDVPKTGGWRPRYPTLIARRRAPWMGTVVFVTPPSVIINAAPCVELGDETLTNPTLGSETLVNPSFASETLVNPVFASEDVC